MAHVPLEREDDGVEIDDPELLAAIDEGCDQVERGEFGRSLDEILDAFRRESQ